MNYSMIIKEAIRNSDMSLSEICQKIRNKGLKTNKSYLSKLQNGKLPPAGDKINKALSEILDIDPVELRSAAYREKLPEDVLNHLINDNEQKEVVI